MLVKLYVENNQIKIREINRTSYKSKTVINERRRLGMLLIAYLKSRKLRREWDKISGAMIPL